MTTHQLTPAQALWQHYNIARNDPMPAAPRTNPVQQKDLYARLQNMGRVATRAQSLAHLVSPHGRVQVHAKTPETVACFPQSKCWQPVRQRDEAFEGLGLSEL